MFCGKKQKLILKTIFIFSLIATALATIVPQHFAHMQDLLNSIDFANIWLPQEDFRDPECRDPECKKRLPCKTCISKVCVYIRPMPCLRAATQTMRLRQDGRIRVNPETKYKRPSLFVVTDFTHAHSEVRESILAMDPGFRRDNPAVVCIVTGYGTSRYAFNKPPKSFTGFIDSGGLVIDTPEAYLEEGTSDRHPVDVAALWLRGIELERFSINWALFPSLTHLVISCPRLWELPFMGIPALTHLSLEGCYLKVLPKELGEIIRGLKYLNLSQNGLSVFPDWFRYGDFETLLLRDNRLNSIPFWLFGVAQNLDISGNPLLKDVTGIAGPVRGVSNLTLNYSVFRGCFPRYPWFLPDLKVLRTDEIPPGIEVLPNLQVLDLETGEERAAVHGGHDDPFYSPAELGFKTHAVLDRLALPLPPEMAEKVLSFFKMSDVYHLL
jgi:hypothetical protein